MTGQDALLQMRRGGMVPGCVWVCDDDTAFSVRASLDWHTEPNPFTGKLAAHIRLAATDIPETLDFRLLVGLRVHMTCHRGASRARRVFDSLAAAKPAFLIAEHDGELWTHGGVNG